MRSQLILLSALSLTFTTSCTTQKKPSVRITPYKYKIDSPNDLPIVYVSFIFTINRPQAKVFDTPLQMYKELEILNRYFIDEKNQKIFKFKINHYYSYRDFNKRKCDLANHLNQPSPIITQNIPDAVKRCFPRRKSKEVLFIIYDSYSQKLKYSDITSWGFRNNAQPFILIDWERLNHQTQAASIHEMGHAFGLGHVCAPKAKKTTPTNIMTSYDCRLGSGGLRNLGFTANQLNTILENYSKYP
ncbi:metalloprotease [Acinetobacter sp. 2JN-4]|uniref:metalloprotease n=1 Tax=Acinetobacter sp. 2JN-4 TaxID=2479844 RepID=UPI000EFA2F72|nr:metalloprotease [Acinetobacter sp. 2JN-4]RLZ11113.1 metalloprotease [Acinetobacter sp. 2JN-4]